MYKRTCRFVWNNICVLWFICLVLLPAANLLQAQAPASAEKGLPFITNYPARTYDALPQTWSIQQDDNGLMYFGIQNYLLEYDGVKWRKIRLGGTASTVIRSLGKSDKGVIFYGCVGDVGYLQKDSTGRAVPKSLNSFIPDQYKTFQDVWSTYSTPKGVYFQSREYIFRISGKAKQGSTPVFKVWAPTTRFMYAFYVDGDYYVHQQGLGLYKMVNDSLTFVAGSEFLGKERMQIMLPYKQGPGREKQYLLGLFYSGLYIYNGKTFSPFATDADPIIKSGANLYKGVSLGNDQYALGTAGKGLVIINSKGSLLQKINRQVGLQDESVYGTFVDKKGTLWLALDNGISRVETASPLTMFGVQSGITTGVLTVNRFDKDLIIGTTNGVLRFNHTNASFEQNNNIPLSQIFNLYPDSTQLLVPGDGLYAIRQNNTDELATSVSGDLTLSALFSPPMHSNYLLGGGAGGVCIFEKVKLQGTHTWRLLGYIKGINDQIWTFGENSDGTIWAGTQNEKVYRIFWSFNQNKLNFNGIKVKVYGAASGLLNCVGQVTAVNGKNYFPADTCLYVFDNKTERFLVDKEVLHIPVAGANNEFNMVPDYKGRIWLRFGKKLFTAVPKPGGGYTNEEAGLNAISELTIQNIYPEPNGIIWFCTTDGLIRYDENMAKKTDAEFNTLLRQISAGKQSITLATATDKPIQVEFANNTLRFEYAAPYFEQEDKTRYQTWLEGFEKEYTDFDNNYYKEYTNLPAGHYKFHVRAKNIHNKLSKEGVYQFDILPPWYRAWWALLAYAIIALAVLYILIKWRTRQLQQQHRELEKTVAERTLQLSQRLEELAVINSVQEGLVREMNMEGIYELVGEKIREIFNAQIIDIVMYDRITNQIEDKYAFEKGDRTLLKPRPVKGFRKHVIETRQCLIINEHVEKVSLQYNNELLIGELPKSMVYVPMIVGEEVKGIISLQHPYKENAFTNTDVNLLTTLANSMSVALESARLFDETNRLLKETEQRTTELSIINSVQESLSKELDIQGIYALVGEKMREVFNAQVIDIVTYDRTTNLIEDRYTYEKGDRTLLGPRPLQGFRKHVIETGQQLVINTDIEKKMLELGNVVMIGEPSKSVVFVPMIAGGEVTGVMSVQNIDEENAFSSSDVRLLATLANSMGVALENARLFDETNRLLKETEQRTAELAVINSVQDGLAKELDMHAIYELVGERIRNVFDAQGVIIASFDETGEHEIFNYAIEKGERFYLAPRPCDKVRQHLINTRKKILINSNYEQARADFGMQVLPGTEYPKSLLFVPLIIGDVVRAYVSLQNVDKENAFSESDVRLLETLANSMSVALENARLFDETNRLLKETEQRTAELAVINSIQDGLAKELDIQGIYELVGDRLCGLFPESQTLVIRTFDHQSGLEYFHYTIEKGIRFSIDARPLNWTSKELIATKKPLNIAVNYIATAEKHGGTGVTKGQPPKSAVFVPLLVGDIVKGSVSLQNVDKENAFTEADLRLLTTISNSMSVALENARLFEETSRLLGETNKRASELVTVNNISQALASQLDLDQLIKLVGDEMLQLFKANIVYLALLDKNTDVISFPYQYGDNMQPLKIGEGLTSKIIKTGKPLLINKDLQELRAQLGVSQIGIPAASYMGVPIPVGDEIIGVLSIQSTEHENRFNENDLRLISTIASSVGAAIRNAQLFEEVKLAKLESEAARGAAEKANLAKSSFLSTVSHELRTPLTSVLGFAKIIKKRLEERIFPLTDTTDSKTAKSIKQVSENLEVVVSEGERLTHLINDVLDLAKIEAGKMEWNIENISMAEVAERALAATSSLFENSAVEINKEIDSTLPTIMGDRDKLIQVMVNLISNSVKFTPQGKVTCRVFRKKAEVVVEISDTGIGIAPEDHAAVFEQFKQVGDTLTDKPKGTGLGLPICKEIVEHHGGRIWLESKLGEGSKFYFALPVSKSFEPNPVHIEDLIRQLKQQVANSKLNTVGTNGRLLIVDDDDSIRSLLNQELTDAGYIIEEATNGKEALDCIRANRPDLVILDVMMPEMNGFDVAAILKNDPKTMDIPIIVLSIIQDKTRGFRIGVDRYLTKPIDTGLLFAEIGSLLEQGKSKKKVMIVDEDSAAVSTLTEVLKTKGYLVLESDEKGLLENAISHLPDIIVMNSELSGKHDVVTSIRFEKGLENVLFLVYQ